MDQIFHPTPVEIAPTDRHRFRDVVEDLHSHGVIRQYAFDAIRAEQKPIRRNVLFLSVDDMNDWVNCLGGYKGMVFTPNIDRLAKRGMLFT